MNTNHTMTDEQRARAWDRVAAEMRAYEQGQHDTAKAINAIVALTFVAAIALVAWAVFGI